MGEQAGWFLELAEAHRADANSTCQSDAEIASWLTVVLATGRTWPTRLISSWLTVENDDDDHDDDDADDAHADDTVVR